MRKKNEDNENFMILYFTDPANIFTTSEQETLKNILKSNDLFLDLKKIFNNSLWTNKQNLEVALKLPLMRACAWYLYKEKRRNYALNNVGKYSMFYKEIFKSQLYKLIIHFLYFSFFLSFIFFRSKFSFT